MKELAEIQVVTDGGPWAVHNMPCTVCGVEHALLYLNDGRFEPCWKCQAKGWRTVRLGRFWLWLLRLFGVARR